MKYIKTYESTNNFKCTVDIRNIEPKKVSLICKKLMNWFPNFRFNSDVEFVADTDPKYLKLNTEDYGYIEVSRIYVYLEEESDYEREHDKQVPLINPEVVFISETAEEFMENVETSKISNKYNI